MEKWTWKHFSFKEADDCHYELSDGLVLKRSNDPERLFYQMNVMKCSDEVFDLLLGDDNPVITMDPPWKTSIIRSDAYNTESDQEMLDFFSKRVSKLFTPNSQEKEGFLFLWYLNNKRTFSLRCLYAAGYELIADETWNKTTNEGNDRAMSLYRGTAEHFFVGRKRFGNEVNDNDWKNVVLNDGANLYTSHSFSGAPFHSNLHSSKPLEFYTDFLPTFLKIYASSLKFHSSFKKCRKLDLFTREIQPGFLSAGLQFHGVRMNFEKSCCIKCFQKVSCEEKWAAGCQKCKRVWHVDCIVKGSSKLGKCFYCIFQTPPQILVHINKEEEMIEDRPLKKSKANKKITTSKKQKQERVRVRGDGKTWWTGSVVSNGKKSKVMVKWDHPNEKGPIQELVDKDCIEWV